MMGRQVLVRAGMFFSLPARWSICSVEELKHTLNLNVGWRADNSEYMVNKLYFHIVTVKVVIPDSDMFASKVT